MNEVNDKGVSGKASTIISSKRISSPSELGERASFLQKQWEGKTIISVCSGPGCKAYGGDNIFSSFEAEIRKRSRIEERESLDSENSKEKNSTKEIIVRKTGCHGWCEMGPVVTIYPQEICYFRVKAEDVSEIVEKAINSEVVERLLYHDEAGNPVPGKWDIPFYKYQKMLLLRDIPKIDPTNIEDYIRLGGYQALARALFEMTPEEVLEEVKKANLRGRGGGGFPAGIKWETTRKALGSPKYVIVNADEGDPGAYMDRAILEGNPHSVIEGLIIGAYAIGSNKGFIYIRQEYPYTLENVNIAIRQAMDYGFLGKDILGSGFDFEIKVHRGAGAYVSGESSALTSAIEGNVGEPRLKYIHMAESGLWGKPTNLNNVETWANVPLIIKNGADWFTSIGTKNNSGTKIFSMVGKVKNTGLVEVPLGISLRDIIFKIGGGIKDGKKFKAVQTGGPSGGVIPEKLLDLPVDFDELSKAGSMMGSGGMVVMDETSCMVNVAYYFLNFLSDESCGKCVPCREGLRQMLYIYERIINGNGREEDIQLLKDLSLVMKEASLCALGTTAPNIVLTTLEHFREEYEAHIYYGMCPAMVCKPLITYVIDLEKCSGCGRCVKACPVNAIVGEPKKPHYINQEICIKCGTCVEVCPDKYMAIEKRSGIKEKQKITKDISMI